MGRDIYIIGKREDGGEARQTVSVGACAYAQERLKEHNRREGEHLKRAGEGEAEEAQ